MHFSINGMARAGGVCPCFRTDRPTQTDRNRTLWPNEYTILYINTRQQLACVWMHERRHISVSCFQWIAESHTRSMNMCDCACEKAACVCRAVHLMNQPAAGRTELVSMFICILGRMYSMWFERCTQNRNGLTECTGNFRPPVTTNFTIWCALACVCLSVCNTRTLLNRILGI